MEIVVVVGIICLVVLFLHSRTEEGKKPIIKKPVIEEENRSGFGGLLFLVTIVLLLFGFFGFGASASTIDTAVSFIVVVIGISLLGLTMFTEKIMPRFGLILFLASIFSIFFVMASIGGL